MAKPWELFSEFTKDVGVAVDTAATQVRETVQTGTEALGSAAAQSYLRSFVDTGVWSEDTFDDNEKEALKSIVMDRIGTGQSSISYKDYNPEGGKKIGYRMALPNLSDPTESLKFTIGKGTIVRDDEGNVMVADEYDFNTGKFSDENLSVLDKAQLLLDAFQDKNVSKYGFLHMLGEAFGAGQGEGASIRAKVGSPEELGLTAEDVQFLPTLKDYESKNKGRIKDRSKKAPTKKKAPVTFVNTDKAFKRYGVVGGNVTLDALKSTGEFPRDFSWDKYSLVTESGEVLAKGQRIPKGMNVRPVRK